MFKAQVPINKKDYVLLNAYYLRKYIGIKEVLLLLFLFVAGMVLGLWARNFFVLAMCAVTLILMAGAIIFYFATSLAGYNMEFKKRLVTQWEMTFDEQGIEIIQYENNQNYTQKRLYTELEKVALLKDRAYIYFGAALMYYVKYDNMTDGNFVELCEFLKDKIEISKFRMKTKRNKKLAK